MYPGQLSHSHTALLMVACARLYCLFMYNATVKTVTFPLRDELASSPKDVMESFTA